MNPAQFQRIVRTRTTVRVTQKSRSALGYDLLLNGQKVSHHPSKKGAVAELGARLVCLPRYKLEVKPTQGTK
jgi:hypothetical protein